MKVTNQELVVAKAAIEQIGKLKQAPKGVYALAKNHRMISLIIDGELEDTRKALVKEHFGEDTGTKDHPGWVPFHKAYAEVLKTQVEVSPHLFPGDALNLEANEIDPVLVSALIWMMQEV